MPVPAVKVVFDRALEIELPADREAYLAEACAGHPDVRQKVETLLRAYADAGSFLEPAPVAANATGTFRGAPANSATATFGHGDPDPTADYPGRDEHVGAVIAGKYKLVEAIGEGGMGSVYMAQQTEPVKRAVAVKVIKAGMDSKAVLARFEAERQALALMDHPNIARVLDAGTTDGGRPFFVMELVKGVPITQFCDERKLTPRERLELFVPVCQAIQHAHQKGVIHRDVKPSNVLIALYDDRPVPKVIDFGVAKSAGSTLTDRTLMTGFGAVVGTPEYMSPEQASLNNLDIDTRSDVYSLGVLLYELLTGSTPVDRKSLGKAALLEVLRIVREVEAQRPSAKLSTTDTLPSVAANRGTEPSKLAKLLKGELDWVLLKALEKDRTRRYATAIGLAADIQRYLADDVVEARPPSVGYRTRKFVRRNKGQVLAMGLVLLALTGGVIGTTTGLIHAEEQRRLAVAAQHAEAERADGERHARADADTARSQAEAQEQQARMRYYSGQVALAAHAVHDGRFTRALDFLETQRPAIGGEDLRGFDWYHLWYLVNRDRTHILAGHHGGSARVSVTPDGKTLATADEAGTVRLWDAETGRLIRAWNAGPAHVFCHAFSPSGRQFACGGLDGRLSVWDVDSKSEVANTAFGVACTSLVWLPDREMIAVGCADGTVQFVGPKGVRHQSFQAHENSVVNRLLATNDGKSLMTVQRGGRGTILYDLSVTPPRRVRDLPGGYGASLSPDGRTLAVAGHNKVFLVDLATGNETARLTGQHGMIHGLTFSPDGNRLLSGCFEDRSVILWDVTRRTALGRWASGYGITDVRFVTGGSGWAVSGVGGKVELWKPHPPEDGNPRDAILGGRALIAPDGATLLLSGAGPLRRWDLQTRTDLAPQPAMDSLMGLSRDGSCAIGVRPPGHALGFADTTTQGFDELTVWDFTARNRRFALRMKGKAMGAAVLAPSGKWAAAGNDHTPVLWWDISGQNPGDPVVVGGLVGCLGVSPDSTTLVVGDENGVVRLWDVATRSEQIQAQHGPAPLSCAAVSPDGKLIVTADEIGTIRFWQSGTLLPVGMLRGNVEVLSIAFFPDGRTLACGRHDGTIQVVDAVTFQERMTWQAHGAYVVSLAVTPDGGTLVSGTLSGPVRIWRTTNAPEAIARRASPTEGTSPTALPTVVWPTGKPY